MLKKENTVIKKELTSLKTTITDIVQAKRRPNTAGSGAPGNAETEYQLRSVLEFQRNRIKNELSITW